MSTRDIEALGLPQRATGPGRFWQDVIVVTGAANGIGRCTAEAFAREGGRVVCVDLSELTDTVQAIAQSGGDAVAVRADVSDPDAAARIDAVTQDVFGAATILANVAGVPDLATAPGLSEISLKRWNHVLAVNLTAPFLLARQLLPGMISSGGGSIVNVSSLAGRLYSLNASAAYSASKAGLLGLTRHLASDYGEHGIRVNAVCPGPVDTPMLRASLGASSPSDPGKLRRRARTEAARLMTPLGRISTAAEQTSAILFLASKEAACITGVALDTNGGFYMA